jgi:hypothetical protein
MPEKESDRDIWERGKETDKHKLAERMIQTGSERLRQTKTDGGRERERQTGREYMKQTETDGREKRVRNIKIEKRE